jgi:hypothetical protein
MSAPERPRANRWFMIASVLMLLTAAAHSMGHFSPLPTDAETQRLVFAMQGYVLDLGMGMKPTQWDVLQSLSLTMTVTLLWLGVLGLVVAVSDMGRRTVQRVVAVYIVANGILVALYSYYRLPPPLISLGIVEAVLLVSFVRAPRN